MKMAPQQFIISYTAEAEKIPGGLFMETPGIINQRR